MPLETSEHEISRRSHEHEARSTSAHQKFDPETVKVTSKLPHNYANDILGNLSRGIRLAWCTMSPPPPGLLCLKIL